MNVRRATSILLCALAVSAMFAATDAGAALRLDTGFGKHGLVRIPGLPSHDESEYSLEVVAGEPDGGLIFTDAEGGLHRLDPAGQVDSGFGDDGTLTLPVPSGGSF